MCLSSRIGYKDCPENRNLVTNFESHEFPLYKKAVEAFNRLHETHSTPELFITDDAYDINRRKIPELRAVRLKDPDNRKELLRFFNILKTLRR